jgi:hypothetical protein
MVTDPILLSYNISFGEQKMIEAAVQSASPGDGPDSTAGKGKIVGGHAAWGTESILLSLRADTT